MADWETVREFASRLPEVEEQVSSRGHPSLRVRGKLFAWISPKAEAEGALVLRVEADEKPLILESSPEVFFETPHYRGYPAVLVHLERVEPEELAERIEDAWLIQAPKRLATEYLARSAS